MMAAVEHSVTDASYEQIPYPSKPYRQAMPSTLATVATVFGMSPADPRRARVLEIGCAGGGNMLPRALEHPRSEFLGIDPALEHVQEGQQLIAALGITNARIERRGLEDLVPQDGPFDYIIAHGVFSWLPEGLREVMLARCEALLAPQGVALISYNTLPGWHMRSMVRDAMLFHTESAPDPQQRIYQARAMLDFLSEEIPRGKSPYGDFLARERELLAQHGDAYLFHDHLAPNNTPMYVRDFVALAEAAGLQYLGEAEIETMMTIGLPPRARSVIDGLSRDLVRTQQYLDFLYNRAFRYSLLVRPEVEPRRSLQWEVFADLYLASDLQRQGDGEPVLRADAPMTFRRGKREIETSSPSLKAAWLVLEERFPEPLAFAAWCQASAERLREAGVAVPDDHESRVGRGALHAYARGLLEAWVHPVPLGGERARCPRASALARHQAAVRCPWGVADRRHGVVRLNPFDRVLLSLCDGTRDHEALQAGLEAAVATGELTLRTSAGNAPSPSLVRAEIQRDLPGRLAWLAGCALLEPPLPET